MSANIEIISQLVPKNNANFAVADVNHLKGGYIQVDTKEEMQAFLLYSNRLKDGMLCFVKENRRFYQLMGDVWKTWQVESGATMSLTTVASLSDLINSSLEVRGQVVFVDDLDTLVYYTGTKWSPFSRIYVQSTEPEDKGGVWIDTSDEVSLNHLNTSAANLISMINILARKVHALEYMRQQISSGGFDNNMYDQYGDIVGIDPEDYISGLDKEDEDDSTTQKWDDDDEALLNNTKLADAEEPKDYYKDTIPNVKHIQVKWGKYSDMVKFSNNFMPAELLWCYNTKQLWIKDPYTYKLIQIGTASSGGGEQETDDIMNGIIQNGDYIASISFVDMLDEKKVYKFGIENGELHLDGPEPENTGGYEQEGANSVNDITYYTLTYEPVVSGSKKSKQSSNINIHMVYAGGGDNDTTDQYSPVNYNFIEISNTATKDVSLTGLYLHYTEGKAEGNNRYWVTLPLKGILPAGNTLLIRGAKCGEDKFAKIKVGKPDLYFHKSQCYNNDILDTPTTSIWDKDGLLKLSHNCALFLSAAIRFNEKDSEMVKFDQPWTLVSPWNAKGVIQGYIDLVGFGQDTDGNSMPCEGTKFTSLNTNILPLRYYTMDNVAQALVAATKRNNSNDWTYINLANTSEKLDLEKYVPKNTKQGKNFFYNKHLIHDGAPTFVTCTFGYNPHTTRCFTWASKGYRDEYLQYRKKGNTEWITIESFKEGDGRSNKNNRANKIYNRIRTFTTDGTYYTVHKVIVDFPETDNKQVYEYRVGYKDNWLDEKEFTLRNRQKAIDNGFQFVQITDQQGFNAEEYETWRLSAEYINKHYSDVYNYEVSTSTEGDIVVTLPTAKEGAPEHLFLLSRYYKKKSTINNTYEYQDYELVEGETFKIYHNEAPNATQESPEIILVGNLWELQNGQYVDIEDPAESGWPASYTVLNTLPETPGDQYVFVGGYKKKVLTNSEITYSYEVTSEPSTNKVTKAPIASETSIDNYALGQGYELKYNDIAFTINTGDATQNGNKINEWVDYFDCGISLFNHLEQQYTVGNNDLCPNIPYALGRGDESEKVNPLNVLYFFTFEHPYELPTDTSGVYIPCVYSYIYGNTYFLCMNSELTATNGGCSYFNQDPAINIYNTIKEWCDRDVAKLNSDIKWKIAYCHEAPFTILTNDNTSKYLDALSEYQKDPSADNLKNYNDSKIRPGSHLNSVGNYWFSKFLEDNEFNLCICGHKHTYSNSKYIKDNSELRMQPIVFDVDGENASWYNNLTDKKPLVKVSNDLVNNRYVKYVMCQATGYKLISNKELPSGGKTNDNDMTALPWLQEYYPITKAAKVNKGQQYPNYIIWEIGRGTETETGNDWDANSQEVFEKTNDRILGKSRKLYRNTMTVAESTKWAYKYNVPIPLKEVSEYGGNGFTNQGYNNIIVRKFNYKR